MGKAKETNTNGTKKRKTSENQPKRPEEDFEFGPRYAARSRAPGLTDMESNLKARLRAIPNKDQGVYLTLHMLEHERKHLIEEQAHLRRALERGERKIKSNKLKMKEILDRMGLVPKCGSKAERKEEAAWSAKKVDV